MDTLFEFSPAVIAIIPLVLGLVQAFKMLGTPSKYAPILAIVIGIALTALTGVAWQSMIAQGIISGLAASGLWSSGKNTIERITTVDLEDDEL